MVTIGGKVKELWGQQFSIVKNGLHEAEVSAFIGRLIDQNNDLANKLGHLHSLTRLAEKTVVEAEERAKRIDIETKKKAEARAITIITRAEEKARARAERIITEAEEKAEAAAERIIAEAQQQAEASAQEKVAFAEQQAQDIIRAAEGKAEAEAQRIRQEAEQLLLRSKQLGEEEIREKFERVCEELLSNYEYAEEMTAISAEEETGAPEPSEAEAAVCLQADTVAEEMQEQLSLGQEEGEKEESPALYDGTVELAIPPPVALDRILKLHKHLAKAPQIKVLDVRGSAGSGIRIKLSLQTHIPLLSFLEALPEVDRVSDRLKEADKLYPPQDRGEKPPLRRIVLTTKK